jgi:hypothetical protein
MEKRRELESLKYELSLNLKGLSSFYFMGGKKNDGKIRRCKKGI